MILSKKQNAVVKLSNATLSDIPQEVTRPNYDRSKLTAGIVHIGLGNFHRAHQAWYLHRLMEIGVAHDWAIIGAGVRAADAAQRDRLLSQDCLNTLIELDPTGTSAEITGAMIDFLPVEEGNATLIEKMTDPAIRIVSLTVTEGGYFIDPATGGFDAQHPDILHDAEHPDTPRTAFGAMIAALRIRRDAGTGPFTGQSCDNLQNNGGILRQTVVSLAKLSDPALAEWIDTTCSFPNSMVDCIVPSTGPAEIALARTFGIDDAAPVTHENFRQWVIEDDFCAGRPDWDKAGANFAENVEAYEFMKLRILNAGHQILANAAEILSVDTISACMAHPAISAFFRKVQTTEIAPLVDAVPGMTSHEYTKLIDRRFSNPSIVDTTRRVAFDGSSRHPGFVLPIVKDALEAGASVSGLALVEAMWARMCEGNREDGSQIEPNDPFWNTLTQVAAQARSTPKVWLEQKQLYGDLADAAPFAESFEKWLALIWSHGAEAALEAYLSE